MSVAGPPDTLPTASPARTRAAVRELLGRQRWHAMAALGALAAAAASGLPVAPLVGAVIDAVVAGSSWGHLVAALAVVAVGQGLLVFVGGALVTGVAERALADLRESYVDRALNLPLERIERAGDGDLTSRVADDVTLVGEAAQSAVPEFTRAVLMIVLTGVGLTALDWRFLPAAFVAAPLQVGAAIWYARRSGGLYAEQRAATGTLQDHLLDTFGGVRTALAHRMEEPRTRAVAERSTRLMRTVRRLVDLHTTFFVVLNAAEFLSLGTALATGLYLVRAGEIGIGVASAAALYVLTLFGPINQALFVLDAMQSATASLARLVGVVDLDPGPTAAVGTGPVEHGAVRASGLVHAYRPGHEVVAGIDLDIADGERVALVGESGAGKTTLAGLLAGLHRPTRGTVVVGAGAPRGPGTPGRPVALVTQEVHVFAGTVAEDLRLADPGASDPVLWSSLARVGADEWVRGLPAGIETVVGRGGRRLTPVQAQQLALARLVLAAPRVAVLDEATAEAGSSGAAVLDRAVDEAVRGRTSVLVAHRLHQARSADVVLVLHRGRVVERGHHDDLLAAGGRYAAMWSVWSAQRAPGSLVIRPGAT